MKFAIEEKRLKKFELRVIEVTEHDQIQQQNRCWAPGRAADVGDLIALLDSDPVIRAAINNYFNARNATSGGQ